MQISQEYLNNIRIHEFTEPNLLFRSNQRNITNNALIGIQNNKPYDYNENIRNFDSIKIIVIHNNDENLQNRTMELIQYLKNGLNYFRGFQSNFSLENLTIPDSIDDFIIYDSIDDNIIYQLNRDYNLASKRNNEIYFAIIVGNDHRAIKNTEEYYHFKKICIENGYPCQYISNFEGPNYSGLLKKMDDKYSLQYALWNLCVAIYCKSGGIPWILNSSTHTNIILAVRFARNRIGSFTTGHVSIFDKDGKFMEIYSNSYKDSNLNLDDSDFRYTSNGLVLPKVIVERMITDTLDNYQRHHRNLPVSISIQKLGYYGKDEQIALVSIMEENFDDFYLLEITDNTLIRLFQDNRTDKMINRGLFIPFANDWGLLSTTGNHIKDKFRGEETINHQLGTPKLLYIKQKYCKNENIELTQHAEDLLALTSLHYQTVTHNELRLPAPLVFASRVAKMKKNGISPHDSLVNTPWFL